MNSLSEPHYGPIINGSSVEDLKLATLRAIDHARKTSAEISEYKARLDGALGTINQLRELVENLQREIQAMKELRS